MYHVNVWLIDWLIDWLIVQDEEELSHLTLIPPPGREYLADRIFLVMEDVILCNSCKIQTFSDA